MNSRFWVADPVKLVLPILIIGGWEVFSRSGVIPQALLPPPSHVVLAWFDWVFAYDGSAQSYSGTWLSDSIASAGRVLAGFSIAAVLGITLGMAIGWSRTIERFLEPTLQVLRPVPPVSWIPLAIIWFGIANKPAIFLVFLGAFFPILLNTIHGVKTVDKNLLRAGAMSGASEHQLRMFVALPAAMPSIFAGLRIAIGMAWMLTVTAEMVAVKSGVGYVLWDSYYFMRYDLVLAAMASIGLLGYVTDILIKRIGMHFLHWQKSVNREGRSQ